MEAQKFQKKILRDYQLEAVEQTIEDLKNHNSVLIQAPTGAGKSLIIAELCRQFYSNNKRILVLAHNSELLKQNSLELYEHMNGDVSVGIYCASLLLKQINKKVIFASRDSLANDEKICGVFDLIIIDECHLADIDLKKENKKNRYEKIISYQFKENSELKIVGLTATPYRKNSLIYGIDNFFKKRSYNIDMRYLINNGNLCEYVFPEKNTTVIKTDGIKVNSFGDFDEKELTLASTTEEVVRKCIENWQELSFGRKLSMFFCCSTVHASVVMNELEKRNINARYIDGDTEQKQRDKIIKAAKEGSIEALVNVNVLTTGVNIPNIDCIVMLRATRSLCLFIQAYGRGMRTSKEKKDCLFLEMAENFKRFRSIENPSLRIRNRKKNKENESGSGEAQNKICPKCKYLWYPTTAICDKEDGGCGHIFYNHKDVVHISNDKSQKNSEMEVNKFHNFSVFAIEKAAKTKSGQTVDIFKFFSRENGQSYDFYFYDQYDNIGVEAWKIAQSIKYRELLRDVYQKNGGVKISENTMKIDKDVLMIKVKSDKYIQKIIKKEILKNDDGE